MAIAPTNMMVAIVYLDDSLCCCRYNYSYYCFLVVVRDNLALMLVKLLTNRVMNVLLLMRSWLPRYLPQTSLFVGISIH